jgi:hypothetical protein
MSLLPGKKRAEHKQPRADDDFYIEPSWCPEQLFATVRFRGPIHDPACGRGNIVRAAWRAGYGATGSDLKDRGFGETGIDFREDFRPRVTLVFNSPANDRDQEPKIGHEEFIRHALEVASDAVAVIVPIPFLCGRNGTGSSTGYVRLRMCSVVHSDLRCRRAIATSRPRMAQRITLG